MEDRELRERLSRIEKHLGMQPYDNSVRTVDRIGELLSFIEEKRKEVKEEAFLGYLKKMEEALYREQVKLDDLSENLHKNYEVYLKRQQELSRAPEPAVREPLVQESVEQETEVRETEIVNAVCEEEIQEETLQETLQAEPIQPEEQDSLEDLFIPEPLLQPAAPQTKETFESRPAKKKDMEFGIGAVVLSIVGALFIIAALVIFGLNFMDNLQQGIFFYVLAGVVIAFSELKLRKHLERFAQAVTGIGVCVLYTATILNYLYLHTMNSVAALVATVAVSVFSLLLSRKRESASLRMIGILGCYISLMPLDRFETVTEFVVPCVILIIVNVIYLLLPVAENDRAVRNVHVSANILASTYLMVMAWTSEIAAGWVFAFLAAMLLIHYAIYYGAKLEGSLIGFYVTGHIWIHALLAFAVWDEKFYVVAALVLALIHGAGIYLRREEKIRWTGLHCFAVYFVIVCSTMTKKELLLGVAVLYLLYKVLARIWNEELRIPDCAVSIGTALLFLLNMNSDTYMQYVLLAVLVLSVVGIKKDKAFHEILLMSVLWMFGLFGFEVLEIAIPLSLTFLLLCVALFTKVEMYRTSNVKVLVIFAWIYNALSLLASVSEIEDPNRISMTIVLLVESVLLMLLFSEDSGTRTENIVRGRTHALTLFFTYMVLAYNIELPIAVSILLMIIAIASVGIGFWFKVKSVRIYGLCMSLFVCAKLLVVDFADAQSADRVISFLVVGVIALAISYLYMRIERSLAEKENL